MAELKYAILFVCMGNICRSPSAAFVFADRLAKSPLADKVIWDSAGTHGYHIGGKADSRTIQTARGRGIDLNPHRARQVEPSDFERFDLIVAMDKANLARLKQDCPAEHQHKLCLMMDWAPETGHIEVPDPYYDGQNAFDLVLDLVESASDGLLSALPERLRN